MSPPSKLVKKFLGLRCLEYLVTVNPPVAADHQLGSIDLVGHTWTHQQTRQKHTQWHTHGCHDFNKPVASDKPREVVGQLNTNVFVIVVLKGTMIALVEMDDNGQNFTHG
jgi:hypothetical protein